MSDAAFNRFAVAVGFVVGCVFAALVLLTIYD